MYSLLKYTKTCTLCGTAFEAQKSTTLYCSHACSSRAYKARKREEKVETFHREQLTISEVNERDFVTVAQAAKLLGLTRQAIYFLLYSGRIPSLQLSSRLTLIRRKDIETMFDTTSPYIKRQTAQQSPITEFYTIKEIMERYKVQKGWIYKVVAEEQIPKTYYKGRAYYSKKHIEKAFGKYEKAKEKRNQKRALEASVSSVVVEYYTVETAMKQFGLSRDSLYHHLKYHNITKVKSGKYIKIVKSELDNLFQQPIIL